MGNFEERIRKQSSKILREDVKNLSVDICKKCQSVVISSNFCPSCGQVVLNEHIEPKNISEELIEGLLSNETGLQAVTNETLEEEKSRKVAFFGGLILLGLSFISYLNFVYIFCFNLVSIGIYLTLYYKKLYEKLILVVPILFVLQIVIFSLYTNRGYDIVDMAGLFVITSCCSNLLIFFSMLKTNRSKREIVENKTPEISLSENKMQDKTASKEIAGNQSFVYKKSLGSRVTNFLLFLLSFIPLIIFASSSESFLSSLGFTSGVSLPFFLILAVGNFIYLLPTFISTTSRKIIIFFFNVIFGVTILGWFILLFLAISGNSKDRQRQEMNYMINNIANK